ncbi:transglutaminase-like domain-containing protein [Clostridium beijerinckii]|uniref:transglutaminase-like domain-containing protein n=1 Tax=Clostridium beijerinckii TaxID=1520 RepID=UPI00047A12A6|nr:transglutaminase-like domain-containing protein [Clostridium beijerinckii]
MNENKAMLVVNGIISGCIQVSIIIALLVFPSIIFNSTSIHSFTENILKQEYSPSENSKIVNSGLFKKIQSIKNTSSKEIIIYNGVTIEEGIKSNEEIDNKATKLTQGAKSDREKAKILYSWIGSNIKYDNEKAQEVLSGGDAQKMPESGAIPAFGSKTGICFDKACLYVAMSRAVNLKVRLLGGQAYDGEQYVGHAWNQVYLEDENKWINVDTTFYDGGNYFDSNLFNKHNVEEIAGEW